MLRIERQAKILNLFHEWGFVQNEDLPNTFDVTLAAFQNDLKSIRQQNLIRLDHGRAKDIGLIESHSEPLCET